MTTWLLDVEWEGHRADVCVRDGRVGRILAGGDGRPAAGDTVIEAAGGWLLPGLHDHHLHVLSLAAAFTSVDCSPVAAPGLAELGAALRADQHPDGWVRGIGHHDAKTGPLDRHVLDRLLPDRPVRIQHRGGALWVLNSLALQRVVHLLDDSDDVERDAQGEPTGRLWRYDSRLAPELPLREPDLGAVGQRLRSLGITGVTDATPDLDETAARLLAEAATDGRLPVAITVLGAGASPPQPLVGGPAKLLLRDHDLPTYDQLAATVEGHRATGRAVAVHCVTVESLVLTLAVLDEVGVVPGDRIEHASVCPQALLPEIKRLGLRVIVQPDLLRTRGREYLVEVEPHDLLDLCPNQRLVGAGIPTACSSDAPFGDLDPWQIVATARSRQTADGAVLGAAESVSTATALSGYLSAAEEPGGPPRRVAVGGAADLLLLRAGRDEALANPHRELVRATLSGGDLHVG
ncbi:amidohydrolase family protein [Nocardioides alcanivorans]|uniref:amidohydrolase family protein n=1 Tax=Nocardioides alcanivorans TaxID=2897352 RepID=UPI001F2F0642|nr:amidohydrolase family protein [Nocardioides alcanivorans]